MGAYSQGGQVLHKAAALLPASTMAAVSSVVIFGDPGMSPLVNIFPCFNLFSSLCMLKHSS